MDGDRHHDHVPVPLKQLRSHTRTHREKHHHHRRVSLQFSGLPSTRSLESYRLGPGKRPVLDQQASHRRLGPTIPVAEAGNMDVAGLALDVVPPQEEFDTAQRDTGLRAFGSLRSTNNVSGKYLRTTDWFRERGTYGKQYSSHCVEKFLM